jgi:hypothetical protein
MLFRNLWIRLFTGDVKRTNISRIPVKYSKEYYEAHYHFCHYSINEGGKLKYPLRNFVYEKIRESENLTDSELLNSLTKGGVELTEADLSKTLMDLEIYGLIRVSWVTKEKKRIELRSAMAP